MATATPTKPTREPISHPYPPTYSSPAPDIGSSSSYHDRFRYASPEAPQNVYPKVHQDDNVADKAQTRGPKIGKNEYAQGWTAEDEAAEAQYVAGGMFEWRHMLKWRFWIRKQWWCKSHLAQLM